MKAVHSALFTSPYSTIVHQRSQKYRALAHPEPSSSATENFYPTEQLYFTMQEIQGITLKDAIQAVHRNGQ